MSPAILGWPVIDLNKRNREPLDLTIDLREIFPSRSIFDVFNGIEPEQTFGRPIYSA
jgi:hypothetical protein